MFGPPPQHHHFSPPPFSLSLFHTATTTTSSLPSSSLICPDLVIKISGLEFGWQHFIATADVCVYATFISKIEIKKKLCVNQHATKSELDWCLFVFFHFLPLPPLPNPLTTQLIGRHAQDIYHAPSSPPSTFPFSWHRRRPIQCCEPIANQPRPPPSLSMHFLGTGLPDCNQVASYANVKFLLRGYPA